MIHGETKVTEARHIKDLKKENGWLKRAAAELTQTCLNCTDYPGRALSLGEEVCSAYFLRYFIRLEDMCLRPVRTQFFTIYYQYNYLHFGSMQ